MISLPAFLLIICISGCGDGGRPMIYGFTSVESCRAAAIEWRDTEPAEDKSFQAFCYNTNKQVSVEVIK